MAKTLTRLGPDVAAGLPALVVIVLGATILTGWITAEPALLLGAAGFHPMVAATAMGFVLAGLTLFAAIGPGPRWHRARLMGATALLALGLAVLAEHVFDISLGIDLEALHAQLAPGDPARGRMTFLTAVAFVLTGVLAAAFDVPGDRWRALVVQALAGTLLALGMVSLIGYDVQPEALVPGFRIRWMPVTTAAGFVAIGVGLLALIARSGWYRKVYERHEDEKILILAMGILLLLSIAMSTAGFSMIQRNLERSVRASLAQAVYDRALILENLLQNRVKRASIISTRPPLIERMTLRRAAPTLMLTRAIQAEGDTFLVSGFTGVAVESAADMVSESGTLLGPVPIEAALQGLEGPAALLWSRGFYIRTRIPIWNDFDVVGHVVAEQPLEIVERLQMEEHALGRTAEWVLCAPEPGRMACFPHRSHRLPRYAPRGVATEALPMEHALAGKTGVVSALDYRGQQVIAGFAPVGNTGLGVVLKIDAAEYYTPVREQLGIWWRWLLALAIVGALLVSSQVRPVAQRLMASERLALERAEELARRERSLRDLYSALGDGIVVLTPEGTIEFANPAAERLFGFAEGELQGKAVGMLIPGSLRDANARATERYVASGTSGMLGKRNLVYPAVRKDGTSIDIEFSLAEMRQESASRIVAVVRDVSEREQLARLKSEFVARVSHELRTPLTAIMGSLELLREEDMGIAAGPARSFVDMALRNTERLALLVNDVIDTERIESGALAFRDADFELAPFLAESVELNQPYAARGKVTLRLAEPLPFVMLRADRDRLMQVMANLLSNAAKFSPAGSEVIVTASVAAGVTRVGVTDRGPGIPEEFRSRVFEKFAQADSSDTREVGGTGLGLAICKAIVERMRGRIGFDTASGVGTTFWFELPAAALPATEA
jgi:PAS domain S-box-containing protein